MLQVKDICHQYGKEQSLNHISFGLEPGKILCLLGPSGCGKSTLLRAIAGLETPHSGTITIGEKDVVDCQKKTFLPTDKRSIGMVFQDYALFPHLNVEKNIAFGLSGRNKAAQIKNISKQVNIEPYLKRYPHTLSGGQQQRVALARALAPNPKLLLLDEPFSGLDSVLRQQLREETLDILRKQGSSTILVTHDGQEALHLGDEIAIMNKGKIEQLGSPDELYFQPRTPFISSFFGNVNTLRGTTKTSYISTALGNIPASGIIPNKKVELSLRYESFILSNEAPQKKFSCTVKVLESRSLGPQVYSRLQTSFENQERILTAHTPGHNPFKVGQSLYLTLQPNLVHAYYSENTQKLKLML